jgi:hypothetical protein
MIPPAQLWVGAPAVLEHQAIITLQSLFCAEQGCGLCISCVQIAAKKHHNVWWVLPEKQQYVKADCEAIAAKCAFMLEQDERFFFIIPYAELLTPQGANSLLKLIEEPPRGYHFILCVERPHMMLPTILSRCVKTVFGAPESRVSVGPFLQLFKDLPTQGLVSFGKLYDSAYITEQMTSLLLDELLVHWKTEFLHNSRASQVLTQLNHAYAFLPMPGSAKLFWKNLYIQLVDNKT